MSSLDALREKWGITDEEMEEARRELQAYIDAYNLKEARKASKLTQVQLAKRLGVSQNRISRMENGDIQSMSLDTIRKYIEAVGGKVSLVAELPTGKLNLL